METTKVRLLLRHRNATTFAESAWFFEKATDVEDFAYFIAKSLVRYESVEIILAPTSYMVTKPLSVEQIKKVIHLMKELSE